MLTAGTMIEVHGIVARPALNGQVGRLLGFHEPSGRYMVELDAAMIRLKPSNVRLIVHLLNLDADLLGSIFVRLQTFRSRLNFREVCRTLRCIAAEPLHWKRIMVADQSFSPRSAHATLPRFIGQPSLSDGLLSKAAFPRAHVEALAFRIAFDARHAASLTTEFGPFRAATPQLDALLVFPRLVELDLSGSTLSLSMLRAALAACATTLRRLDISSVRCPYHHPGRGAAGYPDSTDDEALENMANPLWDAEEETFRFCWPTGRPMDRAERRRIGGWRTKSIGWFDELSAVFEPLQELRVLHAREVCRASALPSGRGSQIFRAVQAHCPLLEELVLGWASEFRHSRRDENGMPSQSPDAEVEFNRSTCLALAHVTNGLSFLRVLNLSGYAMLGDSSMRQLCEKCPSLTIVDLCGCRALTDEGLSAALPLIARPLKSLNVRGTGFGDSTALALAAAGADFRQLNASCTGLSGRGLVAISEASTRLLTLDLCYSLAVTDVETPQQLLATFYKHGDALRMLGLGGFARMNAVMLTRILRMCPKLEDLGIGGCAGLGVFADGEEADAADHVLMSLPELCPNLTALNAHRLPGVVSPGALQTLLRDLPNLAELDVHGTMFASPLVSEEKGSYGKPSKFSSPCGSGLEALTRWQGLGKHRAGEFVDSGNTTSFISPVGCVFLREDQFRLALR